MAGLLHFAKINTGRAGCRHGHRPRTHRRRRAGFAVSGTPAATVARPEPRLLETRACWPATCLGYCR